MTGQALARRNVPDVDEVFYFPFDLGVFDAARWTSSSLDCS